MGLLRRFDPPAYLPDFEDLPGLLDQWHEAVSGWFDNSIDSEKSAIADQDDGKPGVVQFYNPARYDPCGPLVEQTIPWNAFPKELLRVLGRDRALAEADQLWPVSRYRPEYDTPTLQRYFYRPQNEYCEWHVTRDLFTGISANPNSNIHGPGHEPLLVLSQVRRSHGNRRKTHSCSDPTPLSTQGVDGYSMKSLFHFEKFACPAALARRVSCTETFVALHAS